MAVGYVAIAVPLGVVLGTRRLWGSKLAAPGAACDLIWSGVCQARQVLLFRFHRVVLRVWVAGVLGAARVAGSGRRVLFSLICGDWLPDDR